jgi:CRISPR system Cascade subunit CasD
MRMSNRHLLLWLEAPLQSWGHDSKFGRRDSLDFPTKSGVLGLICCARGKGGEEREFLASFADLAMQVAAYTRKDRKGKAVSRQPLLQDFHMVGSGYDDKDNWSKLNVLRTQAGKIPDKGGTKMTYRYYVQDMAYAVVLEAPDHLAQDIHEALIAPTWDLYLGRKCCVPTEFIAQGLFRTSQEAKCHAEEFAEKKQRVRIFEVLDGDGEGESLTLNDVPLQFGKQKLYRDRRVSIIQAS